jgi:hypothetical protein
MTGHSDSVAIRATTGRLSLRTIARAVIFRTVNGAFDMTVTRGWSFKARPFSLRASVEYIHY